MLNKRKRKGLQRPKGVSCCNRLETMERDFGILKHRVMGQVAASKGKLEGFLLQSFISKGKGGRLLMATDKEGRERALVQIMEGKRIYLGLWSHTHIFFGPFFHKPNV